MGPAWANVPGVSEPWLGCCQLPGPTCRPTPGCRLDGAFCCLHHNLSLYPQTLKGVPCCCPIPPGTPQADQPGDEGVKPSGLWQAEGSSLPLLTPPLPRVHSLGCNFSSLAAVGQSRCCCGGSVSTLNICPEDLNRLLAPSVCPGGHCACRRCPGTARRREEVPTKGAGAGIGRTTSVLVTLRSNSLVETIILDKAPI